MSRGVVSLPALAALGLMGVACAVDFPDYELEGGGATGNGGAGGAETLAADGAPCSTDDECLNGHCLPTGSEQASVCCASECDVTSADSCGTTGNCNPDRASCALHPMEPAAGLTFMATTADDDSESFYYTSSGAVSDDALATSELGIGGFINVPAGEVIVRAARAEDTSTPIGEATVTIRPQTITILRLGPTP